MPETKFGTFEELLQITKDSQKETVVHLREVVLSIHPEAVEVVRLGDRAATYGLGPKKVSESYVYILPHTSWVNLGFFQGADLPDPDDLLEGSGKKLRHVKIHSATAAENSNIRSLIQAALAERKQALSR
jgi:hypothetical protein